MFLTSIMNTFFVSIEVLGKENVPAHGPIIFTGNHMNQFVDAALILVTSPLQVGFLIAEKSFHKPIIGHMAKAVGSIPVKRPQDYAKKAAGRLKFEGTVVIGEGTEFTKIKKGDKIRPGKSPDVYKLIDIKSDTEATVAIEKGVTSPLDEKTCQGQFCEFQILEFIDQVCFISNSKK